MGVCRQLLAARPRLLRSERATLPRRRPVNARARRPGGSEDGVGQNARSGHTQRHRATQHATDEPAAHWASAISEGARQAPERTRLATPAPANAKRPRNATQQHPFGAGNTTEVCTGRARPASVARAALPVTVKYLSRRTVSDLDGLKAAIAGVEEQLADARAQLRESEATIERLNATRIEAEGRFAITRRAVSDFEARLEEQRRALVSATREAAAAGYERAMRERDAAVEQAMAAVRTLIVAFEALDAARESVPKAAQEARRAGAVVPSVPPAESSVSEEEWRRLHELLGAQSQARLDEELSRLPRGAATRRDREASASPARGGTGSRLPSRRHATRPAAARVRAVRRPLPGPLNACGGHSLSSASLDNHWRLTYVEYGDAASTVAFGARLRQSASSRRSRCMVLAWTRPTRAGTFT